jgi:tripartite-type tricarboxylate transporter receptor subunit TctC
VGGFPMLQATYTLGLYAPPGTPTAIIEKLNAVANEALTSTTVQAGLRELGGTARGGSVSEVTAYMATSAKAQAEIVAAAGIRPE